VIASRNLKATAAGFVALIASATLATALVATSPTSVHHVADGSSVATATATTSPAPVTSPSPADVTWGG
jgi:hypothetical protein